MATKLFFLLATFALDLKLSSGHGVLVDPPNRSSLWRFFDSNQPANYNDNQLFCGGAYVQHGLNAGKCGVCGDSYSDPVPRANENTGFYGNGIVARTYPSGAVIEVTINVTANHLGSFTYSLCVLSDASKAEDESCFKDLPLGDGSPTHKVVKDEVFVQDRIQLPTGLTCERCVLRWHYETGNSWGICDDGTSGVGCGPQETFRSCADIAII